MTPSTRTIPIKVNLKSYGNVYKVMDAIDTLTGDDLGELSCYGFDEGPELQDRIMMGVVEAILEKETLKDDCRYVVKLETKADGKIIHPITAEFDGVNPPEYPPNWRVTFKTAVFPYLPFENKHMEITEEARSYANRMRTHVLPNFPVEVLIEWFHRHPKMIETYSFLPFEKLQFDLQVWQLDELPGCEAVNSPELCEQNVSRFAQRLKEGSWVHDDMNKNGTWNTPILLMENSANNLTFPGGELFKSPYHLLEGHTRLSCLIALKRLNQANDTHKVWLVRRSV